jgi:hypothetical protein
MAATDTSFHTGLTRIRHADLIDQKRQRFAVVGRAGQLPALTVREHVCAGPAVGDSGRCS